MRVTIHTPGVLVEEYDVPDTLRDGPDEAILAKVRRARPTTSHQIGGDEPVVFSRGADPTTEAANRFTAAREALERAKADAQAAARTAADAGASEHALAKQFGVNRLTIREWRGKGR